MNSKKTLPMLVAGWADIGATVDPIRKLVRTTPELRALGEQVGPVRLYDDREGAMIRAAFLARQARLAGAKPEVTPC
jgi:hypothetical protein